MTRVFVFDLDDTLLNRSKRVGSDTRRELLYRVEVGDHIIFATSRPIRAVRYMLDSELFARADIISLNGAVHHSVEGQVTQHAYLGNKAQVLSSNEDIVNTTHIYLESTGECFATNAVYTDQELEKVHFTTRDMIIPLEYFDFAKTSKVALDGLGKNLEHFSPYIRSLNLNPVPCLDGTFLNVLAPDSDKSSTLQKILDLRGLHSEETVVFGDDIPDIDMMKMGQIMQLAGEGKQDVATKMLKDAGLTDEDIQGFWAAGMRMMEKMMKQKQKEKNS